MEIQNPATFGLKETVQGADNGKEAKLRKACADFEAIILRQMLKVMRETVPKDGIFGQSYATDMYQSLHDSALADDMAQGGGMGIGELLYQQLSAKNSSPSGK